MLTIFRLNSFLQVLIILGIFIALRLLFLTDELPILSDELIRVLTGQKLSEGFSLYKEILVTEGPLTSYLYLLIYNVSGNNFFAYDIFAALLALIQVFIFSNIVRKRSLFNEFSYIPAIIFVLLTFLSFDFLKLSPALIANTFVLLGVNNILKQLSKNESLRDDVFEGSLFLGIATLFHHSAILFLIWAILVLGIYTSLNFKQAVMVFLGWMLPILFVAFIFYFGGAFDSFIEIWLINFNKFVSVTLLSIRDIIISFTIPIIFSLLGIFKVFRESRFNSFQNRSHQALILLGIFAILVFILSGEYTPANLYFFIIPLAFYIAAFFQLSKKIFLPEILFLVFAVLIIFNSYIGYNKVAGLSSNLLAGYRLENNDNYNRFANKKILVTGKEIGYYQYSKAATGYLDWQFAKNDFENINNYMNISNLNKNLNKDLPEVIIDNEGVMSGVFRKIPDLGKKYRSAGNNTYELISK